MNFDFMQGILNVLNKHPRGCTIQNLVERTGLSRGTIKVHLDVLVYTKQVDEIKYNQNVKVYFANIKKVIHREE